MSAEALSFTAEDSSADLAPRARWLVLLLIPLGWAATTPLFPNDRLEYAALSLVATAALALALSQLRGPRSHLHLWVILGFLLVAYFAKFYLLLLMYHTDPDTLSPFQPRAGRFERTDTLLGAFGIMTGALVVLACYLAIRGRTRRGDVTPPVGRELRGLAAQPGAHWGTVIGALIIASAVLSVVSLALQWRFQLGVVSTAGPEEPPPFHLAGILQLTRLVAIPLLLLQALWLADLTRRPRLVAVAAASLLLHGAASTLWSTSKSPFTEAVLALLLLWLLTGRITPRRRTVLIAMIPLLLLVNTLVHEARMLRAVSNAEAVDALRTAATVASEADSPSAVLGMTGLTLVMRITGIEPLLDIMNWRSRPAAWSLDYFMTNRVDVNSAYAIEVLGYAPTDLIGTAYSTGLLGFFYFVSDSAWLTVLLMLIYVVGWDRAFTALRRRPLLTGPVVDAMLLVTLAICTMEGAVQALPLNLGLLACIAIVGELSVRGALDVAGGSSAAGVPRSGGRGASLLTPETR